MESVTRDPIQTQTPREEALWAMTAWLCSMVCLAGFFWAMWNYVRVAAEEARIQRRTAIPVKVGELGDIVDFPNRPDLLGVPLAALVEPMHRDAVIRENPTTLHVWGLNGWETLEVLR